MNVKDRHRHLLFPTPIWQFMFEGCQELNEEIYRDVVSFDWEGYKKAHNLHFGDDLSSRAEDTFIPIDRALSLLPVLKFVADCAAEAGADYGWDLENRSLEVTEFWANVNRPYDYNMRHNHVPGHLSGVYYVKVPDGSGDIRFYDDRRLRTVTEPAPVRDSGLASRSYTFHPTAGMMLMFPSWLDHIVGQNKTNEIRLSISFNIDLVKPKRHVAPA
jgi:uncharacterized protein (TIGR02466 family)